MRMTAAFMIADFERMATDLDREIKVEQDRAGIHDPGHFAYPTYAKAAINRRENLKRSADELKGQYDDAKEALAEAFEELKKVELLDERDQMRERAAAEAIEQSELDGIGLMTNGEWRVANSEWRTAVLFLSSIPYSLLAIRSTMRRRGPRHHPAAAPARRRPNIR